MVTAVVRIDRRARRNYITVLSCPYCRREHHHLGGREEIGTTRRAHCHGGDYVLQLAD